jgi:hypothetical protein
VAHRYWRRIFYVHSRLPLREGAATSAALVRLSTLDPTKFPWFGWTASSVRTFLRRSTMPLSLLLSLPRTWVGRHSFDARRMAAAAAIRRASVPADTSTRRHAEGVRGGGCVAPNSCASHLRAWMFHLRVSRRVLRLSGRHAHRWNPPIHARRCVPRAQLFPAEIGQNRETRHAQTIATRCVLRFKRRHAHRWNPPIHAHLYVRDDRFFAAVYLLFHQNFEVFWVKVPPRNPLSRGRRSQFRIESEFNRSPKRAPRFGRKRGDFEKRLEF